MTESQMYWLLMLDNVRGFLLAMCIITGMASGVCCLARLIGFDIMEADTVTFVRRIIIRLLPIALLSGLALTFLPTTKQMAAIIIVPKICSAVESNEQLKQLPNNLFTLANEWMEELRPPKKAEQGK